MLYIWFDEDDWLMADRGTQSERERERKKNKEAIKYWRMQSSHISRRNMMLVVWFRTKQHIEGVTRSSIYMMMNVYYTM